MNDVIDRIETLRLAIRREWMAPESESELLDQAVSLLGTKDEAKRCDGLRLLSVCKAERAESVLLRSLAEGASPRERSVAAIALADRSTRGDIARALMNRVSDIAEDATVRGAAAWSLRGTTDESVLVALWRMIDDVDEVPALRELAARAVLETGENLAAASASPSLASLPERTRAAIDGLRKWIGQSAEQAHRTFQRVIEALARVSNDRLRPSFGHFGRSRDTEVQRAHVKYFPGVDHPPDLPVDFEVPVSMPLAVVTSVGSKAREIRIELDPGSEKACRLDEVLGDDRAMEKLTIFMVIPVPSDSTLGEREQVHLPAAAMRVGSPGRLTFVATGSPGSLPAALREALRKDSAPSSTCSIHVFALDPLVFIDPTRGEA